MIVIASLAERLVKRLLKETGVLRAEAGISYRLFHKKGLHE
jgi:hypothetical protein